MILNQPVRIVMVEVMYMVWCGKKLRPTNGHYKRENKRVEAKSYSNLKLKTCTEIKPDKHQDQDQDQNQTQTQKITHNMTRIKNGKQGVGDS